MTAEAGAGAGAGRAGACIGRGVVARGGGAVVGRGARPGLDAAAGCAGRVRAAVWAGSTTGRAGEAPPIIGEPVGSTLAAGLGAGDVTEFVIVCALSGVALGTDLALPAALLAGVIQQAVAP